VNHSITRDAWLFVQCTWYRRMSAVACACFFNGFADIARQIDLAPEGIALSVLSTRGGAPAMAASVRCADARQIGVGDWALRERPPRRSCGPTLGTRPGALLCPTSRTLKPTTVTMAEDDESLVKITESRPQLI